MTRLPRRDRGAAMLLTLLLMLMLAGLATAVGVCSQNSLLIGSTALRDKQAFYIAEAGVQRARQALAAGTWTAATTPGNSYTESFGAGEYVVTITDNSGSLVLSGSTDYTITAQAYVPNQTTPAARRSLMEYEADVTVASTNYALTATASASTAHASHPAANAKDGDTSTKWQANVNDDGWLALDFGSSRSLSRIIVKEDSNVTGVTIEYSDNGSSWNAVAGASVAESGTTWTATFTATSHRYFRAVCAAASNKKPSVKEIEAYDSSSTTVTFDDAGEVATGW